MKKIITMFICAFALNQLLAQNNFQGYYYTSGKAHYWLEDSTSANIIVRNMAHYNAIVRNLQEIFTDKKDEIIASNEDDNIMINSIQLPRIPQDRLIAAIQVEEGDIAFFTYAKRVTDNPLWLRNEVLVKYKSGRLPTMETMRNMLSRYSLHSIAYNSDNEYSIYCENERDVIEIANTLYDTNIVEYSTPDFYSNISLYANDPLYSKQWGLHNTGQDDGTNNADINAPEAWNFVNALLGTTGRNIKVAVIDQGIIAASHNNMGVAGIETNENYRISNIKFHLKNK